MHDANASRDAELACEFVASRIERKVGRTYRQGKRKPPLSSRSTSSSVRLFAEERLHRVPRPAALALLTWAEGFPVERLETIPDPLHVLELQAEGRRCVSLLSDEVCTFPHEDALAFALHDLCHLTKFTDPPHYHGQVGFSATVLRAMTSDAWPDFARGFDATFVDDLHHVIADMNGSSIFLFAALKMKLKMAVRRRCERIAGAPPRQVGPLTAEENASYEGVLDEFLQLLDLDATLHDVARRVSARRDHPDAARAMLSFFSATGGAIVTERRGSVLLPIPRW